MFPKEFHTPSKSKTACKVKSKIGKIEKLVVDFKLSEEDKETTEPCVGIRHARHRNISHVNKGN